MKTLLFIAGMILTGCNGVLKNDDAIQSFIPGTYSSHAEGEYSIADDTLVISKVSNNGNAYTIVRYISYQRIIEKKIQLVTTAEQTKGNIWQNGTHTGDIMVITAYHLIY